MDQIPHGLSVVLGTLPFLGVAVLLLVIAALAADRDRLIVPGTVAALVLIAGLSAAMEFGPQAAHSLASRPGTVAVDPVNPDDAGQPGEDADRPEPTSDAPADGDPSEPAPSGDVPVGYAPGDLVSVPGSATPPTVVIDRATGRRTVVVNPGAPGQPPATPAAPPPATRPTTLQPAPAQPAAPAAPGRPTYSVPTTPAPTAPVTRPSTLAQNRPPELPNLPTGSASAPGAGGGTGTLVVKINGPLVETSPNPSGSAHVMVILDGKEAHARGPSRTAENRKDNDPAQPLLATTYFWENVSFTFSNVEAGHHVLMVDSSLDSQGSHRSSMTGSGQEKNDWNGSIEVKAGQTTVVEFGAKNWMNGQLSRVR